MTHPLGKLAHKSKVAWLAAALSSLLVACGGDPVEPPPPPRFETTSVGGTAAVRDNVTGITWAAGLGSTNLPSGASVPTATELLQLTDQGAATLRPLFGFVLDASPPLIRAQDVTGVPNRVWAVDFGVVALGGLSDQATPLTTNPAPDVSSWMVLSRRAAAPSVTYPAAPASNGTVTAGGLMWKVCTEGTTWSGTACTGTPSLVVSSAAQGLADGANTARFAGSADWRVPSQQELRALIQLDNNLSNASSTLLPAAFTTDRLGVVPLYWSSSRSANAGQAWVADFSGSTDPGGMVLAPITDLAHVRLVRTAP